jgi:hypothetical protein
MLECKGCHRYIHATETSCPFCAAPLALASAASFSKGPMVTFAAGLSLLACIESSDDSGESNAVTTDPSTSESASSSSDTTSTAGDGDGDTTVGDGDGDTTVGDGDGDTQETLDYSGSDYGGPPPCDELGSAIPLIFGSNPVDTTMSGNAFNTSCDDQFGSGPDLMLQFIAPLDGNYNFALTGANFDAWLLESGYYCYAYNEDACVLNQAFYTDMLQGQLLYLILDSPTDGGGTVSIDITQP